MEAVQKKADRLGVDVVVHTPPLRRRQLLQADYTFCNIVVNFSMMFRGMLRMGASGSRALSISFRFLFLFKELEEIFSA